jgi:hypothetical protein
MHLLTFAQQTTSGKEYTLIRALNLKQFDKTTATADFSKLMKEVKVLDHTETTLNGIVPLKHSEDFTVQLDPLEIKTYLARLGNH